MKNALIIHGTCDKQEYFNSNFPSLSNSHWLPWLQKELLIHGVFTQTPEMPNAYMPVYEEWKREFERYDIGSNTTLIGHSCGGGFLVRWLSENNLKVEKLVLVAPWLDPNKEKTPGLFDFSIDKDLKNRVESIHLFYSTNDSDDVLLSVNRILKELPEIIVSKFKFHGHFTYGEMRSHKFPELLNIILNRSETSYKTVLNNLLLRFNAFFS